MKIISFLLVFFLSTISSFESYQVDNDLNSMSVALSTNSSKIAYIKNNSSSSKKDINIYDSEDKTITTISDGIKPYLGYEWSSLLNNNYFCWLDLNSVNGQYYSIYVFSFQNNEKTKITDNDAYYGNMGIIDNYLCWIECNKIDGWSLFYVDLNNISTPILIKKLTDNQLLPRYFSMFKYNNKPYLLFSDSLNSGSGIALYDFFDNSTTFIADTNFIETHPVYIDGKIFFITFQKNDPFVDPIEDFSEESTMYCYTIDDKICKSVLSFDEHSYPRLISNINFENNLLYTYIINGKQNFYCYNLLDGVSSFIVGSSNNINSIIVYTNSCTNNRVIYKGTSNDGFQSIFCRDLKKTEPILIYQTINPFDIIFTPGIVNNEYVIVHGQRKRDEVTKKYKITNIALQTLSDGSD